LVPFVCMYVQQVRAGQCRNVRDSVHWGRAYLQQSDGQISSFPQHVYASALYHYFEEMRTLLQAGVTPGSPQLTELMARYDTEVVS
jgi:hypothetical protein